MRPRRRHRGSSARDYPGCGEGTPLIIRSTREHYLAATPVLELVDGVFS